MVLEDEIDVLSSNREPSLEDIVGFLEQLPEEELIEHQVNLAKLVGRIESATEHLETILEADGVSGVDSDDIELRFAAFKGLATYHRRNMNITRLESLHRDYGHLFSGRPMYDSVYSVLLRVKGDPTDIRRAINLQEKVLDEVTENPGIYQAHANTITLAVEGDIIPEEEVDDHLERARKSIDRAISLWREYGKYHVTKGRILALQGEYERSRRKIREGIDLEDPEKEDYAIRIGQFQQHLLRTDFREYETKLKGRLNSAESKLSEIEEESEEVVDGLRNTMLQFLGFFTAIIAAIITTTQIATNYSPSAAGHLIVMIFGGLTASFGGLSMIIPNEEAARRGIVVTTLGLVLIVGALIPFYI